MSKYVFDETIERLQYANPWYGMSESEPHSEETHKHLPGINVCGYLQDESGWGSASRGYVRALRSLDIPMALNSVSPLTSNRSEDRSVTTCGWEYPYDINLVCVDAAQHFAVMSHIGEDFFENRYNVGAWAWELPRFPENWYDRFAYYDEIWVATSFIVNALAPISPVPVVRIPPVLTAQAPGARDEGRRRLGVSPDEFVFLFVFDFHSHLERKNTLALIDAFKLAFAPNETARLVIKCVNGQSDPAGSMAMKERAQGHAISIYDGYWSSQEIRDLMSACDAYVSLHRSEGTGLTITDAMALGKPVIATGWSGNMDFMNVCNSYPVRYELVEIEKNVGPYRAGELWAEPSKEHAAELMVRVFANRDEGQTRGQAAKREIESNYSEEKIASLVQHRLNIIRNRERFPQIRRELRAFHSRYRGLIAGIRQVAEDVLPPDAVVIVISKGDDELLRLGSRRGLHFPQNAGGLYAGYHPADSDAAIAHLEQLRAEGANYLLLPGTAFWWLDFYKEFAAYLESYFEMIHRDPRSIIYKLNSIGAAKHIHELVAQVDSLSHLEARLRMLLLNEQHEIEPSAAVQPSPIDRNSILDPVQQNDPRQRSGDNTPGPYPKLLEEIRQVVEEMLPVNVSVIVISKGDEELLRLGSRRGLHFPQTIAGAYAGYHPADSRAAIRQLEKLRAKGGNYLLLPSTAFWWLDFYKEFKRHLDLQYQLIYRDRRCLIYELRPSEPVGPETKPKGFWRQAGRLLGWRPYAAQERPQRITN
jgi:glycosyltransferase involved in cell wall biosynthesis